MILFHARRLREMGSVLERTLSVLVMSMLFVTVFKKKKKKIYIYS